jgi:hypothetical protein
MEEAFFVPCTRMHDLMCAWNVEHEHGDDGDGDFYFPEDIGIEEVELRAGAGKGAVDFFHHPDFTFDDFWQLEHRKIVWIGPEIFVETVGGDEDFRETLMEFVACFGYESLFSVSPATSLYTSEDNERLRVCSRSVTDATTTVCDYVLQLMTTSNTIWKQLEINVLPSDSTHTLSRCLKNSCSTGGTISFEDHHLSRLSQDHLRDYLRVLEISAGPHHRIELRRQTNWSQMLTATLANFLQRCQCVIVLDCYTFPVPTLIIDTLRGDCNVVELDLQWMPDIDGLVRALAENKSLVRLTFAGIHISDTNWAVLCQSLSSHPRLEYLKLFRTFPCELQDGHSDERKSRRTDVFLKMLQSNTVLQELDARRYVPVPRFDEFDERILSDVIQPHFRRLPHVRAFGKYRGPGYAQVLARALYKVDDSPALLGMLISNNIPTILGLGEDN